MAFLQLFFNQLVSVCQWMYEVSSQVCLHRCQSIDIHLMTRKCPNTFVFILTVYVFFSCLKSVFVPGVHFPKASLANCACMFHLALLVTTTCDHSYMLLGNAPQDWKLYVIEKKSPCMHTCFLHFKQTVDLSNITGKRAVFPNSSTIKM